MKIASGSMYMYDAPHLQLQHELDQLSHACYEMAAGLFSFSLYPQLVVLVIITFNGWCWSLSGPTVLHLIVCVLLGLL